MIEQAQSTMDAKKRYELYQRINRLWVDDAAAMPLYQQLDLYGATKRMVWKARATRPSRATTWVSSSGHVAGLGGPGPFRGPRRRKDGLE